MVEKRGDTAEASIANKLILKKAADIKIKQILLKAFISEKEVYDLVRGFFKKYLEIDYEFTHDELMKELRRVYLSPDVQAKVHSLLERISEIEHLSRSFSKEELEKIISDFKELVDLMIVSHYEKHSFIRRMKDGLARPFSQKHKDVFNESALLSEDERSIVKMNILLDDAKRLSETDIERAKKLYKELMQLYDSLDDLKKNAYFKPVNDLYMIIKNRSR